MARIVVLYGPPTDAAAFDSYYYEKHVPIAKKIPGLKRYIVSTGPVMAMDGTTPYHLVAELEFESTAAIQQAMGTPEGQATAADVANFATGSVTILMFDEKDV